MINMKEKKRYKVRNMSVKVRSVKVKNYNNLFMQESENKKYESEKFLPSEKCGAAEVESPRMADAAFQQN